MSPFAGRLILIIALAMAAGVIVMLRRLWLPAAAHAVPSIWRIASITVSEARRRRVLQAVIALVALIMISMLFVAYLSPAEQSRMLISGGLSAITVFGILLSIFVAAFLIPQEIQNRTIYPILAKPVRRFEFVLGKYLGALIVLGLMVAVMTGVLVLILLISDHYVQDQPGSVFDPNLAKVVFAAAMSYCALAVLTALIILISTIGSTTMTIISAFIAWALGSLQSTFLDSIQQTTGFAHLVLILFYNVVPKLENFDFRHEVANFMPISVVGAWQAVLHGAGYILVVLILASLFFNDRQV